MQVHHVLKQLRESDSAHFCLAVCGQQGKAFRNVAQGVDLLGGGLGVALQPRLKIGGAISPRTVQVLGPQLQWRQRVFDLMGDLLGHLAPRPFPLQRRARIHALFQLSQQGVVRRHQTPDLVLPAVRERFALAPLQRIGLHVRAQAPQRAHNRVGQGKPKKSHQEKQKGVHGRQTKQERLPVRLLGQARVVMDVSQRKNLSSSRPQRPNDFRASPHVGDLRSSLSLSGRFQDTRVQGQGHRAVRRPWAR